MFKYSTAHLREDIVIAKSQDNYLITHPNSGETFEFGEEEFFLCKSLDGKASTEEILAKFKSRFGVSLNEEYLRDFYSQIAELGLLEKGFNGDNDAIISEHQELEKKEQVELEKKTGLYLFNPENLLTKVVFKLNNILLLLKLSAWLLIPGLPLAAITFFTNQELIQEDISKRAYPLSYLGSLLFTLIIANLFSRVVQAIVCTYFGGKVTEFGIRLNFGIIPRVYIDKTGINQLNRQGKLWTYGSSLIFRLILFVVGVFIWYLFRGTGTQLSLWAILIIQTGLIGFLLVSLPIYSSDGYQWFVTYFNLPPTLWKRAFQVLKRTIERKPLPSTISQQERVALVVYGAIILVGWGALFSKITSSIIGGLTRSFPGIFGRATEFLILCLVMGLTLRWLLPKVFKFTRNKEEEEKELVSDEQQNNPRKKKLIKLGLLFGLGVILSLPLPYRPGGELKLLQAQQQQIQAPVSGKIVQVFFNGGDGKLIKAGTVVAKMLSTEIDNNIVKLEEKIKEQKANIEKQQANLNKLVTGASQEEIELAKSQVRIEEEKVNLALREVAVIQPEVSAAKVARERAVAEVEIAKQQLETAQVSAKYSESEVLRLEELYHQGGIGLRQLEEARKKAETDKIQIQERQNNLTVKQVNVTEMEQKLAGAEKQVEKMQQNVITMGKSLDQAQANLQLVLSGSREEDIAAATQQIEAEKAVLRGLEQELNYTLELQKGTELVMPFDGYLVDSYLNQKMGSYLNLGDDFATVQEDSKLIVEMELPEYDAGEINLGATAKVKLLAYPHKSVLGTVISVEPATREEVYGRVVNVLIELEDTGMNLKPGMSGYGKIDVGKKAIALLLTRPLLRFIQIEFWSWLP